MKTFNSKSPPCEDTEDAELFKKAMQDVTPLKNNKAPVISTLGPKTHKNGYLKYVRRKNSAPQKAALTFREVDATNPVSSFESIRHSEKGLRPKDFVRLKNSDFELEAVLDLHGKTAEEAELAIDHFIQQAIHCAMKYIRIIHGKGHNSEHDYPVLKNVCYQKLKSYKSVVAFCSAPEKDGGAGAVNIQLRS